MSYKFFRLPFVLLLIILLLGVVAPGQVRAAGPWYVSTSGDDSNDCLGPTTPCATINGAIGKATPGDTINVATGTYTGSGTEVVSIDKDITLSGGWDADFATQSGRSTLDGQEERRGLLVNSGLTARVERFALQHGNLTGNGGGINNAGNLTLVDSMINNNNAGSGNGSALYNTESGVLAVRNSIIHHNGSDEQCWTIENHGSLTIENSVIEDNTTTTRYCARLTVINFAGTLTLTDTAIRNNLGGVYNFAALTLNNSSITGNIGSDGPGGIYNWEGSLTVNNSTISSNSTSNGGGIFAGGGGIVRLNNATISHNTASQAGGGIYNHPGSPAQILMQNTILAGNTVSVVGPDCSGTIGSTGYNLVGDVTDCDFSTTTGDLTNIDATLGSLIGSPAYHPLFVGSPAIDAGNPAGCTDQDGNLLATDQRGVARVGNCEIGAYEYTTPGQATTLLILSGDAQRTVTTSPFAKPFQLAALDTQGSPVEGVLIDFSAPGSGPSGTFADTGTNTTQVTTDASGVATTSVFTANDQAGSYTVAASTAGAASMDFHLEQVDRPANDDLANPSIIASLPFSDSLDITLATKEPGEPSHCGSPPQGQSVWYSFTPTTNMVISVNTAGSSFSNANLTIFQAMGPGFEGLTFVNNGCFGTSLTFNAQAGTTYYIQAERASSSAANLQLNLQEIPAPANDNFGSAEMITSLPFSATVDNSGATLESGEPEGCSFPFRSVWYVFTPAENMAVRLDMPGSQVGGTISIFLASGPEFSDLTFLTCVSSDNSTNFQMEAGKDYYLRVDSFGQPGSLQINLEQIVPPANDGFANAEVITSLPFTGTVDNTNATIEPGEPSGCGSLRRSAWYTFTPAENMAVRLDMSGALPGIVGFYVLTGSSMSDLSSLTCAYTDNPTNFQVEAGKTYYLQVDSLGQPGNLQINLERIFPPANDNFANAEAITSLPFTATVENIDATLEPGEPGVCTMVSGRTLWYSFTPTEDIALRVDFSGSAVRAELGVYLSDGSGLSTLVPMVCTFGRTSANFNFQAGQTYYLQLDSDFGQPGSLQISLEQITPPANDNFDSAEIITSLPFSATVDNTNATIEPGEGTECFSQFRSVWYSFSPAENVEVRLNSLGSAVQGNVSIYLATGPSISDLTFMTCTASSSSIHPQLEAGNTYFLRVDSYEEPGAIQVNMVPATPPANDDFASAEAVLSVPFNATVDITDAGIEPDEPQNCSFMFATAWYYFTPSETMVLRANTLGSSINGTVNIYSSSGPGFSDLQFLSCSGPGGSPSFQAEAGQTYYFQVGAAFPESATMQVNLLQAVPPSNDNFTSAEAVTTLPFSTTIDISDATNEPEEPQFCIFMPNTAWYAFTTTETKKLRIGTQDSPIAANVNVYRGTGNGFPDLQFMQCSGFGGAASFLAEAGESYYFQVGGSGEAGTARFNLTEVPTITGRVIDAVTGFPLPGNAEPYAYVQLYRVCGDGCIESVISQQVDSEGRFFFDSDYSGNPLPAGEYQIEATASLYLTTLLEPFAFTGASLDLGDLPLTPPAVIRGRAVDTDTGNPLPGASVTLLGCPAGSCSEFVNSQNADELGQFNFNTFSNGAPLSGGTYELEIAAAVHETRRIQVQITDGENRDLGDVALTALPFIGSIRGRLLDNATGNPVSQVFTPSVELYRCTNGNCYEFVNSQVPDSQGRFRFETDWSGNPLIVGTYQILASADQYQQAQSALFDVGEGMHRTVGNLRITSFPVRFSEIQACTEIPASGGECAFSVKIWNGRATRLRGEAWSVVNAVLPDTFAGITDFQPEGSQNLDLDKGRSGTFRFRFRIPANQSSQGGFLCSRLFVGQGNNSLWNTIGYRDLFCVTRNAQGISIASPQAAMAPAETTVTATDPATESEPNNSCQTAQSVGTVPLPFVLDGNLDSSQSPDVDFYRFEGVPGAAVVVDLAGAPTGQGTLSDPFLGFFDSNCSLLAMNDDFTSLNSHLEITIPADGAYILGATICCDSEFAGGGEGSYQLTVTPVELIGSISGRVTGMAGIPLRGDVEPFAFVRLLQCGDFGCFDVNSQATDSEGRFLFESDANGEPLRAGNYQIVVSANQYRVGQTEQFAVGEAEEYDTGDFALAPFPVVFSNARPCVVPARGGTCEFSVKIINGLSTRLSGKAWSMASGSGIGSPINFTAFQTDTPVNVRLDPGRSTTLRFRFRVPGSVANGASICGLVYVGQNPSPFFAPVGLNVVFCLTKGDAGFTLMSPQEAQAASQQMQIQEIAPPELFPDKKK